MMPIVLAIGLVAKASGLWCRAWAEVRRGLGWPGGRVVCPCLNRDGGYCGGDEPPQVGHFRVRAAVRLGHVLTYHALASFPPVIFAVFNTPNPLNTPPPPPRTS